MHTFYFYFTNLGDYLIFKFFVCFVAVCLFVCCLLFVCLFVVCLLVVCLFVCCLLFVVCCLLFVVCCLFVCLLFMGVSSLGPLALISILVIK